MVTRIKPSTMFFAVMLPVAALTLPAAAQPLKSRLSIRDAATRISSAPAVRTVVVQKVKREVRTVNRTVRVSSLSVVTAPGARVVLDPLAPGARPLRPVVADAKGSAIFDNVAPGKYKISASKDGFETQEQDEVVIKAQTPHVLDMDLNPITYKLRIRTNLTGGEVFYAQAVYKGTDANKNVISEQLGDYCVVKINKNGEAVISDLKQGYYDIDIRPDDLKFEETSVGANVPGDTGGTVPGETTAEFNLATKFSTETFGTAWAREDWDNLPARWSLSNGLRVRDTAGIVLPRDPRYLYYTNFEMISDVKLNGGGSLGFAVRAVDPRNYYLIQLVGSGGGEANILKGYIVENGQAKQFFPSLSIAGFSGALASRDGFRVIIRGTDKGFDIWIEGSDWGQPRMVTSIRDPYNTFQKGAVGIATLGPANFDVRSFQVCYNLCR